VIVARLRAQKRGVRARVVKSMAGFRRYCCLRVVSVERGLF
jgi:hypothetical protein